MENRTAFDAGGVPYGSRWSRRSARPPDSRACPIFLPRQRSRREFTPLGIWYALAQRVCRGSVD